ncbi:peroxidase [Corallococcus praedator]|uniref:Peroxidase n=1 Tax=Corallococcus praedator TaxID=2316724 RepID=A0ABX9Q7F1_9BACT|nr:MULTISPECIES: peroxidase [Corallococcus]RKH35136.1 peroxidase [Corallococcus sp. CA031C]RKH93461.1 peroxidase [Corallococcus praedator]
MKKPPAPEPMYLPDVESHESDGHYGRMIAMARASGFPSPQIWHLFAFKPRMTEALSAFTHEVMRGPSPLSAGLRELIAAYTSRRNACVF